MFERPEQVVDYWIDFIGQRKGQLGFNQVTGYDQKIATDYPLMAISPGKLEKQLHGSRTWLYVWRTQFFVMHATASGDHLQRSREEAALVTRTVAAIELDKTMQDQIIFGYVEGETPGVIQPLTTKGALVLSTRLDWVGTSEGRF